MLLERPGEVVTREELQQKLWPNGTFVDFDHSLNTAVNRIREALGDTADNPRFIETLPRRGYRFIAPVEVTLTPAPAPPGIGPSEGPQHAVPAAAQEIAGAVHEPPLPRRRALALTAGGLVAVAALLIGSYVGRWRERLLRTAAPVPIDSIAVLPLENLSHDPEQEYFADGMTEELITTLGKIGSLRVISLTSVKQYKGTKKPLPDIARELGVDAIVEGTVLRSGNRVRITANLLHAPNDRHLWAETYERDLHDVLVLQGEVARAIANEVQIKLAPGAKMRLWGAHSVKPEAYETYLKGTNKCDVELLEKAVKLDPDYAPAYAALAGCTYIPALFGGLSPSQAFPKIKESALSALERDDTLAE